MSIAIVMGVSGSGKSELCRRVVGRVGLGGRWIEGDDLHPPENIAKMASGVPLDDRDRQPWLKKINARLHEVKGDASSECPVLVSCSALKESYREKLREGFEEGEVTFIWLDISDEAELQARLTGRSQHFMPASLVRSQLDALETPRGCVRLDATRPKEELAQILISHLSNRL